MTPVMRTLAALVAAAWLLRLGVLGAVLRWDTAGLHVDEAQYWDWSRDLQWGYYSKPPGIAVVIRVSTALFGDGVVGLRAGAMLLHGVAALLLAGLARDMARSCAGPSDPRAPDRAACWAAAIALTNPVAGLLGLVATTDAPLLVAWTGAAWALWRAVEHDRWRDWLLLGLVLGLGLLSKYTMAALVVAVPALAWRVSPSRRAARVGRAWVAMIAVAACVAPHLAWNAEQGWPTWRHTAEITVEAQRPPGGSVLASVGEWLIGQWLMAGPLWGLLPVLVAAGPPPGRDRTVAHVLCWIVLPLLALGLVQSMQARAQVNWTAPALQGVVLLLALSLAPAGQGRARRIAAGVAVAHLVLVTGLPLTGVIARACSGPDALPPRSLDLWARMRGWEAAFAELAPAARPLLPGAVLIGAGRTVIAQGRFHWRHAPGGGMFQALRLPGTDQVASDHYQLTAGWPGDSVADLAGGRPVLVVSEGAAAPAWAPGAERLAESRQMQGRGKLLHLTLWRTTWPPS